MGKSGLSYDGSRSDVTLVSQATVPNKYIYDVQKTTSILIEISGTATSAAISFKGIQPSGAKLSKQVIADYDFSLADSVGNNSAWRCGVAGLDGFEVSIDSISGGFVKILIREVEQNV